MFLLCSTSFLINHPLYIHHTLSYTSNIPNKMIFVRISSSFVSQFYMTILMAMSNVMYINSVWELIRICSELVYLVFMCMTRSEVIQSFLSTYIVFIYTDTMFIPILSIHMTHNVSHTYPRHCTYLVQETSLEVIQSFDHLPHLFI